METMMTNIVEVSSPEEFTKGYLAFQQHEKRDAMYKIATFLIDHFWRKTPEMADSLGVLLLTWNQAFYRYGPLDFDELEKCLSANLNLLDGYRKRSILSYSSADDEPIKYLFQQFHDALQICVGGKKRASPVAAAKTLHLLAPAFFPLWDDQIARAYHCYYIYNPADKYLSFLTKMRQLAEKLQTSVNAQGTGKTLLKLIDEYNYAKYTKGWV
jgi:hypothetical protein